MSRIVTVFGATGTQGSSLIEALLEDKTFTPRAVTRDISSKAAQDLRASGAQVVVASLTADVETLKAAIAGSEAVFIMTQPFLPGRSEKEQGQVIIDVCKSTGVKFIVLTSVRGISGVTDDELNKVLEVVNEKEHVEKYLKTSGIPHAIIHPRLFLENCWKQNCFKPNDPASSEAGYTYVRPRVGYEQQEIFTWASKDVGSSVLALLKHYNNPAKAETILGQTFMVGGGKATGNEVAAALSKGLGKSVTYVSLSTSGIPLYDKYMDYLSKHDKYMSHPYGVPDRRLVELGAKFGTVEEFAAANKARLFAMESGEFLQAYKDDMLKQRSESSG